MEPHDRCSNALCSLGRAHVGGCLIGGVTQAMPAAVPVAPAADADTAELDQYLIDLAAEANEHDENARHHQRLAKDARDRAAHLRAWRSKAGL